MARKYKKEDMKPEVYAHFREYDKQFQKETYYKLMIRIRRDDTEVLDKLDSVDSKAQYILRLIREDIAREKGL